MVLCNEKNTDVITDTSNPTSLQYEECKKQSRTKKTNPSR